MKFNFFRATINEDFDPAQMLSGFETEDRARQKRRLLASALTELGEAGRALALRLESCGFIKCGSAGCPVCLRAFRRWWGSTLAGYMSRDPEDWFTVSIVPPDLFDIGHLHRFRWNILKDRLRNQIARSPISRAIILGGIDYNLLHFDDDRPPRWRPHLYFLASGGGQGLIESAFGKYYPEDEDTQRPVRVTRQRTDVKDLLWTATYTFKARFENRKPCIDMRGNADTEHDELALPHQAELAIFLDRQGFFRPHGPAWQRPNVGRAYHALRAAILAYFDTALVAILQVDAASTRMAQ